MTDSKFCASYHFSSLFYVYAALLAYAEIIQNQFLFVTYFRIKNADTEKEWKRKGQKKSCQIASLSFFSTKIHKQNNQLNIA